LLRGRATTTPRPVTPPLGEKEREEEERGERSGHSSEREREHERGRGRANSTPPQRLESAVEHEEAQRNPACVLQ
jgi:hypothetical protein